MSAARQPDSARARRIITLLHLFSEQEQLPLATVAKALETDIDTARREIDLLSCCGVLGTDEQLVPVFIDDESGEEMVVFWGEPPGLDRKLRLSAAESRALVAALTGAGLGSGDPLVSKLQAAMNSATSFESIEQMLRGSVALSDPSVLKVVTLALEQRSVLRITYHTGGSEEGAERDIEPLRLTQERGEWYVEAYCHDACDLRTFRVDRISAAQPTGRSFETDRTLPAAIDFDLTELPIARIRLAAGEDYSARYWPGSRVVETTGDGARVIEIPYAGTSWIARQVVARLGHAEVLEPDEVRRAVVRLAQEIITEDYADPQ